MKKLLLSTALIMSATSSFADVLTDAQEDTLTSYIGSTWLGSNHNVSSTLKGIEFVAEILDETTTVSVLTDETNDHGLPVYKEVTLYTFAQENDPTLGNNETLTSVANDNIDGVIRSVNSAAFGNLDTNNARTVTDLKNAIKADLKEFDDNGSDEEGQLGSAWFKSVETEAALAMAMVNAALFKDLSLSAQERTNHENAVAAYNTAYEKWAEADAVAVTLANSKFK